MKKTHETLTTENAHTASTIVNKEHPEWGVHKFSHNEQPLTDGRYASTRGTGSNSAVLFEENYTHWNIASYK